MIGALPTLAELLFVWFYELIPINLDFKERMFYNGLESSKRIDGMGEYHGNGV